MKNALIVLGLLLIFSIGLTGCNLPGGPTPTTPVDMLNTAAAQTIQAQQTGIAQTSEAAIQTQIVTATLPQQPGEGTAAATAPQPTQTLIPTETPTPTTASVCDRAAFVSETIPDGTDFNPGETFTKTWTLQNSGSCNWNSNYDVVFVSGDAMGAPAAVQLTSETVQPDESIKITLDLQAPIAAGTHRGEFKLRNDNGVLFGIGEKDGPFWVEIDVEGTLFDFTEDYCASDVTWTSGAGTLPCPGSAGDSAGWVRKINNPTLETGAVDDEPGLQVHPQMVNDGWIRGTYPEISITGGVYFRAIIGCYGSSDCDVRFKLNAKIDGGAEQTLATWREVQDGDFNRVEVDLSDLAGENVQFVLLVEANGSAANDEALWFGPRIEP